MFYVLGRSALYVFFFLNDTATTEIYTLSLHDALPISPDLERDVGEDRHRGLPPTGGIRQRHVDRKSTRLNSSHTVISYAVFCLKKKIRGCLGHRVKVFLRAAFCHPFFQISCFISLIYG